MKSTYEQVDLIGKKDAENGNNCRASGYQVPLDSEGSSYWRCDPNVQWFSRVHYRILWNEGRAQELAQNVAVRQDAQSLQGDIPQKQREITLKSFRNGDLEFWLQPTLLHVG